MRKNKSQPESLALKKEAQVEQKKLSRRGVIRHTVNPFVKTAAENCKTGVKKIANKTGDKFLIISEQTGELIAPAGFHEIVEVDKTQFVKLYINGVKAFQGLKAAGVKVFELIYMAVQNLPGSDTIYLHFMEIDQRITQISRATFNRGMNELLEKDFIAESEIPGKYFLNIDYLFNGNRLAFIKEFRIVAQKEIIQSQKEYIEHEQETAQKLTNIQQQFLEIE